MDSTKSNLFDFSVFKNMDAMVIIEARSILWSPPPPSRAPTPPRRAPICFCVSFPSTPPKMLPMRGPRPSPAWEPRAASIGAAWESRSPLSKGDNTSSTASASRSILFSRNSDVIKGLNNRRVCSGLVSIVSTLVPADVEFRNRDTRDMTSKLSRAP
ncbi:hypothetical protein E2C01_006150 [Portunus trituberculatus]|uniref:Uncharacterized protein n=1 Tax=Portunus trituberculatus TaxID=210409 RepID=A0A5B7CUD8_PORTR|nr:hypothetical protein [Portunus trituberculatus]